MAYLHIGELRVNANAYEKFSLHKGELFQLEPFKKQVENKGKEYYVYIQYIQKARVRYASFCPCHRTGF